MYLDIIIGIIIVFSLLYGVRNGLFVVFLAIFGLVVNFIIAKKYTPAVIEFLGLSKDKDRYFVTYIITFWAVYILLGIVIHLVRNILKNQSKGIATRVLGGVIGIAKGVLLSVLILLIYNYSTDMYTSLKKYSKGSYTNEIFLEVVPNIEKYVPEVFQDKIKELKNLELINRYVNKLF